MVIFQEQFQLFDDQASGTIASQHGVLESTRGPNKFGSKVERLLDFFPESQP
jgi:hypothetical protein